VNLSLEHPATEAPVVNSERTWESVEEMRRGVALLLQGNPYFAWQLPDGSYRPCYQLAQLEQFEAGILDGTYTSGFYSIRPDNQTWWGAIDFDAHGTVGADRWRDRAQRAFDLLAKRFPEAWLVESSPGSFHVIPFAAELLPAADMRRIIREVEPDKTVEVFPKQDALDATKPRAKGSLLRFPGHHQLKRTWARFLARSGHVQDVAGVTPAEKPGRYEAPSAKAKFLSLYAVVTRGLHLTGNRERFDAMQVIVGRLKGRTLDETVAADIHDRFWNQYRARIQTPIDDSRAYFLSWFRNAKPCNADFPDSEPTPAQAAMIAALPPVPGVPHDRLVATVRLFLSAKKHADATGREFCLGLPTIARRVGVLSYNSASKYRNACYKVGLIKMVERGRYTEGKASTYELNPEWQR
jgi:hypothetical protein